ncbi:MAG: hypothetical protein M1820_007617 [Bogoriella megaspora]|nr:MAG: hypothetical protein M1820_007617 [Bogoriella megaspora]
MGRHKQSSHHGSMSNLCKNRPEGSSVASSIHPGLPTTCFLDVIITPLATWLFMALLLGLLPIYLISRRKTAPLLRQPPKDLDTDSMPAPRAQPASKKQKIAKRVFNFAYYALIVCLIGMVALEIARLSVAELGVGLLPFTLVGILLALGMRLCWKARVARFANAAYWIMLVIVMSIKLAAEVKEGNSSFVRLKDDGVQGKYPTSDEVIDVATMIGVEVVLAALEYPAWTRLENF